MEINAKPTLDLIKTLVGLMAVGFAVFFFLDDRHAHHAELDGSETELRQRILMSESTRYAEVAKYYIDKMKDGETLTKAEEARLDLVQRQQERIGRVLTDE